MNIQLINGDCLQEMAKIPDGSVDMVLCDPPYGTTACKWDTVIPFEPLWAAYKRVCKKNAAIVLTASQPFTSFLIMNNIKDFKYCWVWDKKIGRGHLVAKKRPMAQHEDIVVFYAAAPTYNPQMVLLDKPQNEYSSEGKSGKKRTEIMGGVTTKEYLPVTRTHRYPKTIITAAMSGKYVHPTQKPVALMEYLIRTYTNAGELVLDNTMGSGTTGVACKKTNRNFIGIELDKTYFDIASKRIAETIGNTEPFCLK
jgi:site-specific DNA-methyltransferase (adenine-specific)